MTETWTVLDKVRTYDTDIAHIMTTAVQHIEKKGQPAADVIMKEAFLSLARLLDLDRSEVIKHALL
jgi:hypothetical protein